MVYVRGSRREPSIDHFVKKVWFFLHPSYKPNDLVEVRFVCVCLSLFECVCTLQPCTQAELPPLVAQLSTWVLI